MARKFDVVLGTGTVWNKDNELVYADHIRNHLRLLDQSTYYALRIRNKKFREKNPELFHWLHDQLDLLDSSPINDTTST